jgi:predicted transcriptional regulator of viral defense system
MLLQRYKTYVNPSAKIGRLVKDGDLTPIIKGLYETDRAVPGYYLANVIYGPSYLSFEYALAWHDLIPEAVFTFTSATCGKRRKKLYDTPFGVFTFRDVPVAAFPYGTELHEEDGRAFMIASAEKAVCDQLYTCSPCSNRNELRQLLFEDLRIDETAFRDADLNEMSELAGLYQTKNHKLLISLLKEMRRHE